MDPVALCVLQALLVLMIPPSAAPAPCPRPCSCPQPTELHCTFRSLSTIPPTVSTNVRRMNLGFNSINTITNKSLAGLMKLELLMVHGNNIHSLPDGAFIDLNSLQMLKMSYNKLKEIKRHTLQGLWALARLHLDHNQLEFIHPDSFHGLTGLRLLQLEGNQLQQLHPDTFTTFTLMGFFHISTLRYLYLSDNELMSLPSRLVATMPQLENLYLHGNLWTCDCNLRWLQNWDKNSPDVLKCKKDRALPGGQLCPMCSSPWNLQGKELQAVENLVCSRPLISSPQRTPQPDDTESEVMTLEDFSEPFGNMSLGLSDEHGNEVDLECSIGEPRELTKINWEQINQLQLMTNITFSVDIECPVNREKYEQLWRLIAYYSNIPAHLKREVMLGKEPHPIYVYKQDSEKDAQYYTGIKVNMMTQPAWLMQTTAGLQLNRLQSSAKMVKLILSTEISETVEVELAQAQRKSWATIKSKNRTRTVYSAMLGSPSEMYCNVHSSGHPVIQWMLPDGSKVEAPYSSADNRVSVSSEGRMVIKAVRHTDTGIYYCIASVHRDLTVLPFHLTVQESSSPLPGEDVSITHIEGRAGSPISIPCMSSGSPDAEINWILPSNNIINLQTNSSRALVYLNGTVHIQQAQVSDSGYYKCIAINQHGVDTLATKVTVIRHKGLIGPVKKFPGRPQSASGINTQIKVPTDDTVEASGDIEDTQAEASISHSDPLRRKISGHVGTGRRGVHPTRNMRRRPQVLRKASGTHVEEKKNIVESRRKINITKSKIDPEKWADILAKIRDKNAPNTVTPPPVQHTTASILTKQTQQPQSTHDQSSNTVNMQEIDGREYFTTTLNPIQTKHHEQYEGTQATSNSYTAMNAHDMITESEFRYIVQAAEVSQITQTTHNMQHKTPDMNLDLHTTSNSVLFLPQTTSAPLHAVTFWQPSTNIVSSSRTISPPENHGTNKNDDRVKTTDLNLNIPNVASSNNDRERSSSGNQNIPLVNTDESQISQEGNGKYLSETTTALQRHTESKDITHDDSQTTAYPTATLVATSARRRGSRLHKPNSRRNNGGRQRRPNRRKQKLVKPTQFIVTTSSIDPHATVKPTSSSLLKIEPLQHTTIHFTTVPFSGSQTVSPDRTSHEQSSVSGHGAEAANIFSSKPVNLPKINSSPVTLAKPQFTNLPAVPSFPTAYPEVDHRMAGSQKTIGISEIASDLDMFTNFTDSFPPLVNPLEETQRATVLEDRGPMPHSYNSSEGFHTVTVQVQTHVGLNQLAHQYTHTQNGTKLPSKDANINFSVLPSQSASDALSIEHKIETASSYTSGRLMTSQSILFVHDLETEQVSSKDHSVPEESRHSSSQNKTTSSEQGNIEINVKQYQQKITTHPPTTSSKSSNVLTPSTVVPYAMLSETLSNAPVERVSDSLDFSLWTTTLPGSQSQNQQIQPITTSEPQRISDSYPETLSSDHRPIPFSTTTFPSLTLTSRKTLFPTTASSQSKPFRKGPLTNKQDVSRKQQLPGPGSISRPRIIKPKSQTFTVNAGTDFQLSCEAEGEPMPFLSWTKAANGVTIAQNTSVQRFEVYPNGTLIIRKVQPMDGGQYQCIVQNQYGIDQMMVSFVVLSQHPSVLLPWQRDVTVHLGDKVDLECTVEGHPLPQVTWVLPNRDHMTAAPLGFAPLQRVAVLSNGTLRISQVTYTDRGIYKCIGSSAAGDDTLSIHLHVSTSQPVIQQAQNESITLPEGSTASIHCTATGAPQPLIRWITPDGIHLTTPEYVTGRNLNLFPNGTLYIQRLDPGKAGMYECLASNMVASSRRTVNVNIKRNPSSAKASITSSSPKRTDVIYGERFLLNCVATGTPVPRIMWRTPSKKLVDAQYSFDPRIKVFPNGTITIHSVTDKDSGDYLCVARNKMGDDYVLLRVNVLTRPAKIKQKQQQSSQEVIYGGDLKVDCVASGAPNPEISWALPDGTMVNPVKQRDVSGGRSRRYVVFDNGTLYFNDVGMPEEGDYTCYAENQLGKDEMKVRVKIKVATSPPKIEEKARKIVRAFYGDTVTLRCNAMRESLITWISPTNKVISTALDKYQVLDDGTLVVQKVHRLDGGNYTCMTRNNGGQDHKVIRLEVLVTSPVINSLNGTANVVKVTTVQDQRTFVDCAAEGIPTPRIMWVLPRNVILPAPYYGNRMTVHQNGTLEIQSPKRMDSGKLICIARNEGGEVRLQVNLDVKEAVERPQITSHKTESLSLTVGNTMTLNCSFGSTKPHATWILPSGTPLHYGSRLSKFFHRPDGSLIISNPTAAEAGSYRCLGHTFQGHVERTFTLSPGRTPEINNRYNSPVSIMNGESLLLHCVTSGDLFRLTWTLPSGVVLNMPQRAGRYAVLPNGTLAIQQVSVYDRGLYVCRASNEYGSSQISVSVTVIAYPPRITSGPPSVTYAKRGVAIQLNCIATGIPKVDVAWETPDKTRLAVSALPRLFGNKYLHPQGSLIIQNPTQRDTGVYRCTARNAVGTDSKVTFLNVF